MADPRSWTPGLFPGLVALLLSLVAGCSTISSEEYDALTRIGIAIMEARSEYQLLPGDTVRVVVYRGATLATEYQQEITVQPDGRITLVNLDKAVEAEGRTVSELQTIIQQLYEPLFKVDSGGGGGRFDVTVQFLTSTKHAWLPDQVYVTGEVKRPIAVPYRRGLTVLQSIAQAGGWLYTGDPSRIVMLRTDADRKTVTKEIDLESVVGHLSNDEELQPGDVVFVPLSVIARLNLFVEFYIRGMIPINPSTVRWMAAGF